MPFMVRNYINGEWAESAPAEHLDVIDPATAERLARVPLSPASELHDAAIAAATAFPEWRATPAVERVQYLFKLKEFFESHLDQLAHQITHENGKTLAESAGELRRAIENIEVACGIPSLLMGDFSEDIARGIDEIMIRQPVGVSAIICPFNFPGMIPFWFLPYALACGNTVIVKPSERVPLTMQRIFELIDSIGFPPGVVNLVNGDKGVVDAILDHESVRTISFVGSTPVAKYIYSRAASNGKRVQCQGGAKNPILVMPDADLETTIRIAADSAFGNAGQRCLAASLAITIGEVRESFTASITEAASSKTVGCGLDEGVEMGPVISQESKARIEMMIEHGIQEGGKVVVDGRGAKIKGYENGYFIKPTVIDQVPPTGKVATTEIFGPVLGLIHVETIEEAIELLNTGRYGNMASLFTSSGASARKFRNEAEAGNIGINIGVAAPMAFFPFSGWKDSFFGDLHGQGKHAVEFFTQTKVVIERWPRAWTRKF
jgi:malonate-semialdehyde dehydrogenase (acetylating)/methylmalonate-semialdehyde dehydrogenase